MADAPLTWIVNNLGELGVEFAGRKFFLYKGDSIEYGVDTPGIAPTLADGTPMRYRPVGKYEFGETQWPMKWILAGRREAMYTDELVYTLGLSDGRPGDCDWRPMPAVDAAPPSPPVAAPAGRYVIFTRPGKVPERKGPYPTTALMESALREIQQAYPDAISMVLVDLPADCWPTSGVEWIDMHGDKRKGRLIAAPQPPRPGTAPLSDEQWPLRSPECWCESCDSAANQGWRSRMSLCPACGDKRCPRAKHHDNDCQKAGHPTTPTPKD